MSVVLGAIVGVGGGAIRDSFVGEVPGIFKSSNYYAVAAIGGSFAYVFFASFGIDPAVAAAICVLTVLVLRYASVYFDWRTGDDPIDLTPYVSRPFERLAYVIRALFLGGGKKERRRRMRKEKTMRFDEESDLFDDGDEGRGKSPAPGSSSASGDTLKYMR